jgi:hypothetical protein
MIKQMSKVAMITAVILMFLTASFPAMTATAATHPQTQPARFCQCVGFVLNTLFYNEPYSNNTVPGDWPTAASMAKQDYWDAAHTKYGYAGWYKLVPNPPAPRFGDVMIMKPEAIVYINLSKDQWILAETPIGGFDDKGNKNGHIGFVQSATYYEKQYIPQSTNGGWLISMQSANWNYGLPVISPPVNGCTNVTNYTIFLPTGNPVSFWRKQ